MGDLSAARFQALFHLSRVKPDEAPPTAAELAKVTLWSSTTSHGYRDPTTSEVERMQGVLARAAKAGLAERLGTSATGARCWRITAAGRVAVLR